MTILHRTREEVVELIARRAGRWRKSNSNSLKSAHFDDAAALVRSMPLPEATEEERRDLGVLLLGRMYAGDDAQTMADAVLAWLRSGQ